jgi:hypothetical protein
MWYENHRYMEEVACIREHSDYQPVPEYQMLVN